MNTWYMRRTKDNETYHSTIVSIEIETAVKLICGHKNKADSSITNLATLSSMKFLHAHIIYNEIPNKSAMLKRCGQWQALLPAGHTVKSPLTAVHS